MAGYDVTAEAQCYMDTLEERCRYCGVPDGDCLHDDDWEEAIPAAEKARILAEQYKRYGAEGKARLDWYCASAQLDSELSSLAGFRRRGETASVIAECEDDVDRARVQERRARHEWNRAKRVLQGGCR